MHPLHCSRLFLNTNSTPTSKSSMFYFPARSFPPIQHHNIEIRVLHRELALLKPLTWRALKYTAWRNGDEIEAHLDTYGQLEKHLIVVITNVDYTHHSNTDDYAHYTARVFAEDGEYIGGLHIYHPWMCMTPDFLPNTFKKAKKVSKSCRIWRRKALADILAKSARVPAALGEFIEGWNFSQA